MALTARQLNRATLERQLLLRRAELTVPAAVRAVVALQAQEPASPYLALWNRVEGFDPADLDAAFAAHEVVKATLMRVTLHAVHAGDHPRFQRAMRPTMRSARFAGGGLTVERADELLADVLAFTAEPRRNAEVERWLTERLGPEREERVWWALRTYAPLVHAPTGGPWSFGPRPAYLTAPTPAHDDETTAVRHLVVRYLEGFGPASVADVAGFAKIPRTQVKAVLDGLVRHEGPDGTELLDVPGGTVPAGDEPAPPRLMAMWDSVLLAYADRGRIIPPDLRPLVIRSNGDVLPTLLVDGHVAGVWRPARDGGIEVTAFGPLGKKTWDAVAAEARALTRFLAPRDPDVYRRHRRWWDRLPPGDTRVLG